MRAGGFSWRAACAAWGEPSPPRLAPGGNGKGGLDSLLPQAILPVRDLFLVFSR
jgi:hypothetical protein